MAGVQITIACIIVPAQLPTQPRRIHAHVKMEDQNRRRLHPRLQQLLQQLQSRRLQQHPKQLQRQRLQQLLQQLQHRHLQQHPKQLQIRLLHHHQLKPQHQLLLVSLLINHALRDLAVVAATIRTEGVRAMEDSCVVEMMVETKKVVAWDRYFLLLLENVNLFLQVRVNLGKRWWVNFFFNSMQKEMSME